MKRGCDDASATPAASHGATTPSVEGASSVAAINPAHQASDTYSGGVAPSKHVAGTGGWPGCDAGGDGAQVLSLGHHAAGTDAAAAGTAGTRILRNSAQSISDAFRLMGANSNTTANRASGPRAPSPIFAPSLAAAAASGIRSADAAHGVAVGVSVAPVTNSAAALRATPTSTLPQQMRAGIGTSGAASSPSAAEGGATVDNNSNNGGLQQELTKAGDDVEGTGTGPAAGAGAIAGDGDKTGTGTGPATDDATASIQQGHNHHADEQQQQQHASKKSKNGHHYVPVSLRVCRLRIAAASSGQRAISSLG